ncbi:MAG: ATP-dependent DNA helicase UvrD2 [Bowdeniella nasicola]|nr:ATP-dependent DNA helicase UvrD2 [Bowdeniella nasicola]
MDLLAALDDDQRVVAEHLRGPLCVLAGAGTGKTRAITYRIANGVKRGVYHPHNVLAVTFTARAAGEMRARLRDLGVGGVQARTFHAAALRQLRYFWPTHIGGTPPGLVEHKIAFIAEAAGRLGLATDRAILRDLAAEIEWAKVQMVTATDYQRRAIAAGRQPIGEIGFSDISQLMSTYGELTTEKGVMDFEDVLLTLVGLLVERNDVAHQIRRQYRHFVVDEYQDVSPLQQRLLDLWLGERDDICVVGDVSQTIYSFTGASSRYLTEFTQRYPNATRVQLTRDYRSTPQVVDVANRLVRTRAGRLPAGAVTLTAQRPSGSPVHYRGYDDDASEAAGVVNQIEQLHRQGVQLADIAILYRTNAQSAPFETALAQANIGYQIRGGERFFQRDDIRRAMVLLRGAAAATTEGSMPHQVREILGTLGWSPQAPTGAGAMRERWDALNALVMLADELHATRGSDLATFNSELAERAAHQLAPTVQGVTLASMHAAKGLEWDAVFLVGLSDGFVPISMADTPAALAEEKRLLYVGVTRAREHLRLSYATARSGRGRRKYSRFLTGIWPEESTSQPSRRDRGTARVQQRAELEGNEALIYERLRNWRDELASSQEKPPFTILHDATLVALAKAQPRTLQQLSMLRGIGTTKLQRYGPTLLALVAGEDPPTP